MHFKIKVSIYLDKEAKEKPAIPRSNTALSWPPLPPSPRPLLHPPPSCHQPLQGALWLQKQFQGEQKSQVQRASWQGDRTPGKGWKRSGDSPQRSVSSKTRIQRVSKTWFLSGLPGQIKRYEVPTGRDVFLLLRCQVCKGIPGFWAPGWISGAGVAIKVSIRLISSLPPQGSRISPTNKAVCDSEHFCELKHSAFYKSAAELS